MNDIENEQDVIRSADEVRLRKFTASDRESPIIEVLFREIVVIDVARSAGDDRTSDFEIAFHPGALDVRITLTAWTEIVRAAQTAIVADETDG